MKEEDARRQLMPYVGSAADIELILQNYDFATTDEALKAGVGQFKRKFISLGGEKRNSIFQKTGKKKLAEAGKSELWDLVTLATKETMQSIIDEILIELGGTISQVSADEEAINTDLLAAEEEVSSTAEEQRSSLYVENAPAEGEAEPIDQINPEEETKIVSETFRDLYKGSVESAGVCAYGVPIIIVKKTVPNVFGLKESLLSDLSQEDLDSFFKFAKSKVTPNEKL